MKSVFEYENYREYLRKVHDSGNRASFSWRAIALRAKISNPNFLRQVMRGERNLGEKTADAVGMAIGLQGAEIEFWILLVKYCQADTDAVRAHYKQELAQFRRNECPTPISEGFSEFYRHWYIPAIRELVTLYDFQNDYSLLAKSLYPPVSETEAKSAVQVLSRYHFIQKDETGRWVESHRSLRSGCPKQSMGLIQYHRDMLEKALKAMLTLDKDKRFIMGMTLGVSKECFRKILAEAEKFKNRVATLALNDSKGDEVVQVALQIFPTGFSPSTSEII